MALSAPLGLAGPGQSPVLSGCPDRVSPAEPQTSPSVAAVVVVAIRVAPAHAFADAHLVVVAIRAVVARWTPVSPLPQHVAASVVESLL